MGVYQDDRWSLFFDVFARGCPLFCSGVKRGSVGTPHLERSPKFRQENASPEAKKHRLFGQKLAKKCPETKNIVPEIVPKKKKIYLHEKCPKVSQNIPDNVPYFKPKMTGFVIRKMFS